jgi:hypothetical protein
MPPRLLGLKWSEDSRCQLGRATLIDELEEGVDVDSSVAR